MRRMLGCVVATALSTSIVDSYFADPIERTRESRYRVSDEDEGLTRQKETKVAFLRGSTENPSVLLNEKSMDRHGESVEQVEVSAVIDPSENLTAEYWVINATTPNPEYHDNGANVDDGQPANSEKEAHLVLLEGSSEHKGSWWQETISKGNHPETAVQNLQTTSSFVADDEKAKPSTTEKGHALPSEKTNVPTIEKASSSLPDKVKRGAEISDTGASGGVKSPDLSGTAKAFDRHEKSKHDAYDAHDKVEQYGHVIDDIVPWRGNELLVSRDLQPEELLQYKPQHSQQLEQSIEQNIEKRDNEPTGKLFEHFERNVAQFDDEEPTKQMVQPGEQPNKRQIADQVDEEREADDDIMKTMIEDRRVRDECDSCETPILPPMLDEILSYDAMLRPSVANVYESWRDLKKNLPSSIPINNSKMSPRKPCNAAFIHCTKIIGEYGEHNGYDEYGEHGESYECDDEPTRTPDMPCKPTTEPRTPGVPTPTITNPNTPNSSSGPTPCPSTPATPCPYTPATPCPSTPAPSPYTPGEPTPSPYTPESPSEPTPCLSTPAPSPYTPGEQTPSPYTPGQPTPSPYTPETPSEPTTSPSTPAPSPYTPGEQTPSPYTPGQPTPSPYTPESPSEPTPCPSTPAPSPPWTGVPTPVPSKPSKATPSPTTRRDQPMPTPAATTKEGVTSTGTSSPASKTTKSTSSSGTNTTAGTTGGTRTGASTKQSSTSSGSAHALSGGAIAGIVIACIVFALIIIGAVLARQRSINRQREEQLFADLSVTGGHPLETDYAAM